MKILYLSDFNCPYSYIGLNRMKNVCNELNLNVEWELKSFELDFDNISTIDMYPTDEIGDIERTASDEGLAIKLEKMPIRSTRDAHRLVKYVQREYPEAALELVFKIFELNFSENEDITNHEAMINAAASCGLEKDEISEFLKRDSLDIEVYLDMDEAISYGITTIPYYIIEYNSERLIIPGAYEKESIKTAFEDLLSGEIKDKSFI